MYYNITRITDLNGNDKTDADSLDRIGRIIDMDDSNIQIGQRLFLICHNPGISKSIYTSLIRDVIKADDGVILKTLNSYYYLIEEDSSES